MFSYYFCLVIEGSGSVPRTNGPDPGGPKTYRSATLIISFRSHLYEEREGSGCVPLTNGSGRAKKNLDPDCQCWSFLFFSSCNHRSQKNMLEKLVENEDDNQMS